jgi:protein TonB
MKKFLLFIIFSFVCIYSQAQKNQTIKAKAVKVSEVLNDGSVIAYTMNNDYDCIKVKITRDPNTFYYDDQIIDVPTGSLIIVGTYRHYSSTYPVVKIPKQEIKEVTPTKNSKISKSKKIYDVVDEMPVFPGGNGALLEYLATHVKYPVVAQENGVQGRVIVSFVVERDGSITDVRVVRSVDPSLDREAARVVSSMPRWTPGKQNGSAVRVKYNVPVMFKLQ